MRSAADEALLAELDRIAPDLISRGRPGKRLDRAERILGLDVRGHPWARLLLACVRWDLAPGQDAAWRHANRALNSFRGRGDTRGVAAAAFVLGCWTLTTGDLAGANLLFREACGTAGEPVQDCEFTLAHSGLGAYAEGRLTAAIAMTEQAVAVARLRGNSPAEVPALVNLGFFHLWTGDFGAALGVLEQAKDVLAGLPDILDRHCAPLCHAAAGVLWALRGDDPSAEAEFGAAMAVAEQVDDAWYRAIVSALRAEFTAHVDARRSLLDARWAIGELDRLDEHWWRAWAAQAAGVAARESGMAVVAETMLREVLCGERQPPLERARGQLLLAETLLRRPDVSAAAPLFRQSMAVFESAGAHY